MPRIFEGRARKREQNTEKKAKWTKEGDRSEKEEEEEQKDRYLQKAGKNYCGSSIRGGGGVAVHAVYTEHRGSTLLSSSLSLSLLLPTPLLLLLFRIGRSLLSAGGGAKQAGRG